MQRLNHQVTNGNVSNKFESVEKENVSALLLHDKPHLIFLGWKQKLCVQNGRHMQYKNKNFFTVTKKCFGPF